MSRIGELAAKVAADKSRSDDLEAAMASTGEIADQLAGSFSSIGAEGKAAQISEVKSQLGQARNTRWLAEGHLEDALGVLQAVGDGQGASEGSSPTASASNSENGSPTEPEGAHTFTTDLDGQPVQVTIVPPNRRTSRAPLARRSLKSRRNGAARSLAGRARRCRSSTTSRATRRRSRIPSTMLHER